MHDEYFLRMFFELNTLSYSQLTSIQQWAWSYDYFKQRKGELDEKKSLAQLQVLAAGNIELYKHMWGQNEDDAAEFADDPDFADNPNGDAFYEDELDDVEAFLAQMNQEQTSSGGDGLGDIW